MKKIILSMAILLSLASFTNAFKFNTDKAFMVKAAQGNLAEIEAGKLALQQSTSDSIKAFAQMMIDDHTSAHSELKSLAQSQNVTLPDSTDDAHRIFKQRLMLVQGKSFDSAYMQAQVKDHVSTIALFEAEVMNGTNPEAKAFANKLLPKLQMHLQHAQQLAGNTSSMNMQH